MLTALPAILLETRRFLIIDKPAGVAVHPGPKTAESLADLLPALVAARRPPPVPVHRLDRDTSGCLLLARDRAALRALSAAFADGAVQKIYHAIIAHPPLTDHGSIAAALGKRSSKADGWRMVADPAGKPATTAWRVLQRRGGLALVQFTPQTGRTHQLRVHATLLGPRCAIVGDPIYGTAHPLGMMLHASSLRLADIWAVPPDTKTARAPCPSRFHALDLGYVD